MSQRTLGKSGLKVHVTNEVFPTRGIAFPLPDPSSTTHESRFEKGVAAKKQIVGDPLDPMGTDAPKDQLNTLRVINQGAKESAS